MRLFRDFLLGWPASDQQEVPENSEGASPPSSPTTLGQRPTLAARRPRSARTTVHRRLTDAGVWNAQYRPRDSASYLDYDSDTGPDQPDRDRDVLSIQSDIRSFGYHDRRD